jgi:hypothetical protein
MAFLSPDIYCCIFIAFIIFLVSYLTKPVVTASGTGMLGPVTGVGYPGAT